MSRVGRGKVFTEFENEINVANEVNAIEVLMSEVKKMEKRLPTIKCDIVTRTLILAEWIKTYKGTTGDQLLDHIIAKYELIDRGFLETLRGFEKKFKACEGEIIFTISAFDPAQGRYANNIRYHYCLARIDGDCFVDSESVLSLNFPTGHVDNWGKGRPHVISQCDLGPSIKEFEWDLNNHNSVLAEDETTLKTQIFIGDAEVWNFFKKAEESTQNEIRRAFKNLKIEKTYTW